MKKRYASLLIGVLALGGLVGCGDSGPASINNLSENAVHGKVYGFNESYSSGDTVTFTVEPDKNFDVDKVSFNGVNLSYQRKDGNKYTYSATAKSGENKVFASFSVMPQADLVEDFDMNIDDKIFDFLNGSFF